MAFTVCSKPKCDAAYLENETQCPKCGTHNFFCDADTEIEAVHVLCERIEEANRQEKAEKLRRLNKLRPLPAWRRMLNRLLFAEE